MSTILQEKYSSYLVLKMSSFPTVLLMVNGDQLTWSPPKNLKNNGLMEPCDPDMKCSNLQECDQAKM